MFNTNFGMEDVRNAYDTVITVQPPDFYVGLANACHGAAMTRSVVDPETLELSIMYLFASYMVRNASVVDKLSNLHAAAQQTRQYLPFVLSALVIGACVEQGWDRLAGEELNWIDVFSPSPDDQATGHALITAARNGTLFTNPTT